MTVGGKRAVFYPARLPKGQRAVSVSLSLIFMLVAIIAAILGMVGI